MRISNKITKKNESSQEQEQKPAEVNKIGSSSLEQKLQDSQGNPQLTKH